MIPIWVYVLATAVQAGVATTISLAANRRAEGYKAALMAHAMLTGTDANAKTFSARTGRQVVDVASGDTVLFERRDGSKILEIQSSNTTRLTVDLL